MSCSRESRQSTGGPDGRRLQLDDPAIYMTQVRTFSWRRVAVESMAVVLSILLAFAIDAWWDATKERERESQLLQGLLADFERTRADLEHRVGAASRMHRNTVVLRDLIAVGAGRPSLAVPDSTILSAIGGPTYQPAMTTLDAALVSGELELVRNVEIRQGIAQWRLTLADTFESEHLVREIGTTRVEPLLSRDVALGQYFDQVLGWEAEEFAIMGNATLTPTLELSGALAARTFYQKFAAEGLADLLDVLDRIVALIGSELGR